MLAMSAGEGLQPGRCPGNVGLGGHERRAPKHAGAAKELVGGWRLRLGDERLQTVQTLTSLQREEVSGPEGIGHGELGARSLELGAKGSSIRAKGIRAKG